MWTRYITGKNAKSNYLFLTQKQHLMVDKELINDFPQSEGLLFQLAETIHQEMQNDEEPHYKVARNLLITYNEYPDVVDEIMMSLCGWTMESLMKKV